MGFTPREVDQMSLWEFSAASGGFMKANSSDETLSSEQAEALAAWIDEPPIWH